MKRFVKRPRRVLASDNTSRKDPRKVEVLNEMLKGIEADEEYEVRIKGEGTKTITLDHSAVRLLIDYYQSGNIEKTTRGKIQN